VDGKQRRGEGMKKATGEGKQMLAEAIMENRRTEEVNFRKGPKRRAVVIARENPCRKRSRIC
jgi:hypothetical protein